MRLPRAEAAEVYRLGVATGCFTPAEAAAWADRAVASDPRPDPALAALPRLPSPAEADAALRHAAAGAPRERAHRVVLGLLARRLAHDRAEAPALRRAVHVFRRLSDVLDDADYADLDAGRSSGLACDAERGPAHEARQAAGRLEAFLDRHGLRPEEFGF